MKKVQILGSGCPKCKALARNVEEALGELGIDCNVEKVTDMNEILSYGVMMTPALVVDGEVKLVGSPSSPAEIVKLLGNG